MRGSLGASDTALARATVLGFVACAALALAGCAHAAPRQPPAPTPPPHVLVVGMEQVALRTSAWVELHAWLASAPDANETDTEIAAAARGYATALAAEDEGDAHARAQLRRTMRALEACDDETCARAAVAGTPFAAPYVAALPAFLTRHWTERAAEARAGVEVARASFGEEVEPIVAKLAQDLALDWPTPPPVVDLVADAPEPRADEPVRIVLAAHSRCFATRSRSETERMHDARVVDCVLAYAALRLASRSALAAAVRRELSARGMTRESDFERAWTALVVHAVATTVTGWEPKHASVLRQSAAAVMPEAMTWLSSGWPARMRGASSVDDIAKSFAAALADARPDVARPTP